MRIGLVDYLDLPSPLPMVKTLFMLNSLFDAVSLIKQDQSIDVVLGGETDRDFFAMLEDPPNEVVGHFNVQTTMSLTCHDVDKISHLKRLLILCGDGKYIKMDSRLRGCDTKART
jgi:hypothetical protein